MDYLAVIIAILKNDLPEWPSLEMVLPASSVKTPPEKRPHWLLLSARPRQSLASLALAVKEMEEIPAYLPSGALLKDAVQRARDWLQDVEALQVGERDDGRFVGALTPCSAGLLTNSVQPCLMSLPAYWVSLL